MKEKNKKKVVFVGAFKNLTRDGGTGGQTYACQSLVNSELSETIDWQKIDSTMESFPPPNIARRMFLGAKRFIKFDRTINRDKTQDVFIMASAGLSFVEKGTMALWAKWKGHYVAFGPRSGLLLDNYENSSLMRRFIPLVLNKCDVVVCQGDSWQRLFREQFGVDQSDLIVIPNWIDIEKYREIREKRKKRKSNDNKVRFLFMGRLVIYKGIFDLIEAVASQKENLVDAEFVICGKGSGFEEAKELATRLGVSSYFDFRGWVVGDEKTKMFVEADVLVLPSHREGMPNIVIEAMGSGIPVIATDVGGVSDVVKDSSMGIVLPSKEPKVLGQALVSLYRDKNKRDTMGANGFAHVKEMHDIRISCQKVGNLFKGDTRQSKDVV